MIDYCVSGLSDIKSSGVFIGTQIVKPAAFVDDLIDPNRTVSDIIESNENAKHFEKIKIDSPLKPINANHCVSIMEKNNVLN